MGLGTLDYLILGAYLLISASAGTIIGRGQKNLSDYFLAGRTLPWWAVSFSIVATETSTLTFIGAPAIAYTGNLTFLQVVMGYFLGRILVSLFLIPAYFRGEIHTAYELLNRYYGPSVRSFSALIFLVSRSLADGVRLFSTGLVLSVVTGLTDESAVVIIGAVTVIYTLLGGMKAVVWNDVAQLLIYLAGALCAFWILLERIPGGWEQVSLLASEEGKFRWLDTSLDLGTAYTFWAGLLGGAFLTFSMQGTDQMMVQRYLACGDRRGSQKALIFSGVIVFAQFFLFLLIGVMLYAFYLQFPAGRSLAQPDRIFPLFIVEQMPTGISGLIVAAIFAAAMSTLSSSLNSLASSSVNDFYRRYAGDEADQAHYLKLSRILTLLWGMVLIAISFMARGWGEVLEVGLTISSITMGSLLGIFLLGILGRRMGDREAVGSMCGGLAAVLIIHESGYVAWTWYVLIGTSVTLGLGFLLGAGSPGPSAADRRGQPE